MSIVHIETLNFYVYLSQIKFWAYLHDTIPTESRIRLILDEGQTQSWPSPESFTKFRVSRRVETENLFCFRIVLSK